VIDDRRRWDCPRCTLTRLTPAGQPGTPMHPCPGMRAMEIPMREAGTDADVRLVEREDYVGDEDVRVDEDGTPWMAAVVIHGDGHEDRFVYAPTAHITIQA
jgi:hypothetical protein